MENETSTWGANLPNIKKSQLDSILKRYKKYLAHKESVMAKHAPGTPYHTRAQRDAQVARERIAIIENAISKQG